MSDSPNKVEINIVTKADLAALDKSKESFSELADSTQATAKEMGVVNVSTEEVGKILGKTEEKAAGTHRQMRLLAHALGSEIPGGAAILESAFTSMEGAEGAAMASTFLLVAGLEMLRSAIDKIAEEQKVAQKIADEFYSDKPSEVIEKQREGFEQAEIAEENYHHNLLRNTRDSIAATAELGSALLKARLAASNEQDSARKGIAEKEIDDMEQRGVLSHAAATKAKEQIDLDYQQRKIAMMIAEDRMETQLLANQYNAKAVGLERDERQEAAAAEKYKTATGAKIANETKIAEAREKIAKAEKAIDELRETGVNEFNIQKLRDSFAKVSGQDGNSISLSEQFTYLSRHFGGIVPRKLFGSEGDMTLATYEGAQNDISGNKKLIQQLQSHSTGLGMSEGDAKSDLDAARDQLRKNRQEVQDLQDKIQLQQQTNSIKESGAFKDFGLSRAGSALSDDREIAGRVASGASVSNSDQQKIMADASRIAGHAVDLNTAAKIIENGANNIGIFMNQLNRLAAVMKQLDSGAIKDLQRQINALSGQVSNARNHQQG